MLSTHEDGAPYTYLFPHPAVASDIVLFSLGNQSLQVLLIERGGEPFKGAWALPGGFLKPDETLEQCAARELAEETGIYEARLFSSGVYSEPSRDPRERIISVAYFGLARSEDLKPKAGSDAAALSWCPLDDLPPLAFDHRKILADAILQLRSRVERFDILLDLMPPAFTLSGLQSAFEAVTGTPTDKRNFRNRVLDCGLIVPTGQMERGAHRPAQLYRRT